MHEDTRDAEARKALERSIYNRTHNRERPEYSSFWNRGLYDAMMNVEFEPELERLGSEYLRGRRVLILGAGTSEVQLVQRFTDQIWALNISDKAVADLQRNFPHVHTFVADAEKLEGFDEKFDVIYCKSILHHLHPIEQVLSAIAKRLVPGGVLFVAMEPGLYNPFAAFGRKFSPSQSHTPGERPFVFSQFSRLVRRDFDVLYERQHFLWSMLLPLVAKKAPRLTPVLQGTLGASLWLERALRSLPYATDLYWVMTGIYCVR